MNGLDCSEEVGWDEEDSFLLELLLSSGVFKLPHVSPSHLNFVKVSPTVTTEPLVSSLHSRLCSSAKSMASWGKCADEASDDESLHAKRVSEIATVARASRFIFNPP